MDKNNHVKEDTKKASRLEIRIQTWQFWGFTIISALIIGLFFNWWVKRGEETYSVTPGLTTPASRMTESDSVSSEFIKPAAREAQQQPDYGASDVIVGTPDLQEARTVPHLNADEPTSDMGQLVHLEGRVEHVIGPNIFSMNLTSEHDDDSILIIHQAGDLAGIAPVEGRAALVKGTVTFLQKDDIDGVISQLYLNDEFNQADFEGRLAIIASTLGENKRQE